MHDLCMATKTISIEIDAYELLVRERKDPKESFSRVIRRVLSERPAMTGEVKPVVAAPLTSGFARTAYEQEATAEAAGR